MSDLERAFAQKEARRKMIEMAGKDGKSPLDGQINKKFMAKVIAKEKAEKEAIVGPARKIKMEDRKKVEPKKVIKKK